MADKKFWARAFIVYAVAEALFHITTYLIEYGQCKKCVLPVTFYLFRYCLSLLLAVMLWTLLGRLHGKPLWQILAGNVLTFFFYYFIYTGYIYMALNSKNGLLVWPVIKGFSFEKVVYGSWYDVGKYVLLITAFYVLQFYNEYRKAAYQRLQLAVLNKDMQLNLLKLQLNPHFYFNTLNNLYGLSRSNSRQLLPALEQMENIMQYVITDCNKPKVLLRQEAEFLKSYVELERLRYEKDTQIEYYQEGDAAEQMIVPLLLIQFVENAFKHGMREKSLNNWLRVDLRVSGNHLQFKVENSSSGPAQTQGIGITSVRHLLNLQYEGRHSIEMSDNNNRFSVILEIHLL